MEQLLKSALERDATSTAPRKAKSARHSRTHSGPVLPAFARLDDASGKDGVGPISAHAAVLYEDKLYVYGGEGEHKKSASLHSLTVGESLTEVPSPSWKEHASKEPPPAVFNHTASVVGDEMWVFGGRYEDDAPTKHIYKFYFLGDVWEEIEASGAVPQPRFGHSASVVNENEIFVFGGQGRTDDNDAEINILGDAYVCLTQSESWSMVIPKETTPAKRTLHSATTVDNKVYIFGGFNGLDYFNDVHVYDAATKDWAPLTFAPGSKTPAPRAGHACASVGDGKIVIHGGFSMEGIFNDFWVLDTKAREWRSLRSSAPGQPTGRHSHSLSFDPSARALLMIGGVNEGGVARDAHFVIALDALLASVAPDSPRALPAIQVHPDTPKDDAAKAAEAAVPPAAPEELKSAATEAERDKETEESDEESEDSAAREVVEARSKTRSPRDGAKTPKDDAEEAIDYERLYAEQQQHLQQLQAAAHDLETRLNDARVQVNSREEQLALLRHELENVHTAEAGAGASDMRNQRAQRLAVMELVHLWNQRNGYQSQLVQLQKHLDVTDVRIQEKLSALSVSMNLAGLLAFLPQSVAKSEHRREGSDDSASPRDDLHPSASKGSIDNFKRKHLDDKPKLKKSMSKSSGVGLRPSTGMAREKSNTQINIEAAAAAAAVGAPGDSGVLSPTSEEREKARLKEKTDKDLAKAIKSAEKDALKKAKEEKKATTKDEKKDGKDKVKEEKKKDDKKKDEKKDEKKEEKKDDKKEKATIKSGADAADIKSAKFKLGNFLLGRQAGAQPTNAKKGDFKPVLDFSLVDVCCKAIEKELDTVGVFRIPGSASAVDRIYSSFADPATLTFAPDESIHNIAGAFKLYLRSLEDPVLPFDLHDDAIRIATALRENASSPTVFEEAKALMAKLPELNSRILGRVVQLLTLTAQKSEQNKMDIQNVAIVFGPTLIRQHPAEETPMSIMESTEKSRAFVALLLERSNDFNFKK